MDVAGLVTQVIVERPHSDMHNALASLEVGQAVAVEAAAAEVSGKDQTRHAILELVKLLSVDNNTPKSTETAVRPAYRAVVERYNYSRRGQINGVVLDTGDFIHLRPKGFARLQLALGQPVEADGDAQLLATATGWAVEATVVNGKDLTSSD